MEKTMHICKPKGDKIICWTGKVDIEDDNIKSINKKEKIGEFEKVVSPVLEGNILFNKNGEKIGLIIGPDHPKFSED